jgi:GalNAc-alpha-(1->4)-GalNAc-alpha-(1->3)-diNAcBac-PP-undecaprenol alpha-1,4-N-acetyl-D-galactosaminyltransferase
MRIAVVMSAIWTGGIERVVVTLVNRWVASGHAVRILTFEPPGTKPAYVLSELVVLEQLGLLKESPTLAAAIWNNMHRVAALRHRLQSFAPDVVLGQATDPSILAILAGLGTRWPTIATEQVHPAYHALPRSWDYLRRMAYPWADAIVVQTDDIAQWARTALRVPAEVMPNPIDLQRFNSASTDAGRPPRTRRQVIAVGRLAPQKGYDLLLAAFARCVERNPAWDLVIYGEGPERTPIEASIASLGLVGRVTLAGNTTMVELAYRNADLFVHAARYEGYPNAVQEALAAGMPVIATDCPGATRQLLGDGRYGLLVRNEDVAELADALGSLMADDNRRSSLARSAREAVLPFEETRIAQRWLDVFDRTIKRRNRRRMPHRLTPLRSDGS